MKGPRPCQSEPFPLWTTRSRAPHGSSGSQRVRAETLLRRLGPRRHKAHVSDPAVLDDYRAILDPQATIAGPSATVVRNRELTDENLERLKDNLFRNQLELGHCLRLPAEGPCECDLFLTGPKSITTPKYAPRLRDRHATELACAERARTRGWARETERHEATARRLCQLLADLGEPIIDNGPSTDSPEGSP